MKFLYVCPISGVARGKKKLYVCRGGERVCTADSTAESLHFFFSHRRKGNAECRSRKRDPCALLPRYSRCRYHKTPGTRSTLRLAFSARLFGRSFAVTFWCPRRVCATAQGSCLTVIVI